MLRCLSLILAFGLGLSACATGGDAGLHAERPTVILIGVDGLRPDYLDRGISPTLSQMRQDGTSAVMRPSFPTVTFPNHYTLVTGKHPDNHGIVGNTMRDAELGRFSLGNAAAVTDGRWWDDAEPIWVTAEKAGLVTGTMFWPGSEAEIGGVRPTYWTRFDQSLPGDARVDQVLAWMDLPVGQRPDFATVYFDIVDTAGHNAGPDGEAVNQALASVDASVTRLIAGLEARGMADRTVLVLVSDHGMAATSPDRVIYFDDLIPADALDIIYSGAAAFLNPTPGREAEVIAALVRRHPNGECWTRETIPERLVLGRHPRVPAIVCAAGAGWLFATRARPVTRAGGAHGYDNQVPEMAATFIATGPGIARGRVLDPIESVDVQPFLARLLGIHAPQGDGDASATAPATDGT